MLCLNPGMFCRLLSAAALLLLASTAHASPINLLLTTEHLWPSVGSPEISYAYRFFEADSNGWPNQTISVPQINLAGGSARVLPGVRQFEIPLDVESLDNVYFTIYGDYVINHPSTLSLYVGLPPEGPFPQWDGLSNAFGPPWIPLANLGDGFGGNFAYFYGYSRGPIGSWELTAAPAEVTPVPEPASMLLLGSGLAAVAARRYRLTRRRSEPRVL